MGLAGWELGILGFSPTVTLVCGLMAISVSENCGICGAKTQIAQMPFEGRVEIDDAGRGPEIVYRGCTLTRQAWVL